VKNILYRRVLFHFVLPNAENDSNEIPVGQLS